MKHDLEFWFDFASPYSFVSAMRIQEWTEPAGIKVRWTPFLLGPVFKKQGWNTSPFNIYPAKGNYMWRDLQRQCEQYHLVYKQPAVFPASSLLATRIAVAASQQSWLIPYCKRVFQMGFADGADIASNQALEWLLAEFVDDPGYWLAQAAVADVKQTLRNRVAEAIGKGLFGAPSFITSDGEIFWGDDRLNSAIKWVLEHRLNDRRTSFHGCGKRVTFGFLQSL